MVERLNQPSRVKEDGPMDCKLLLYEENKVYVYTDAGIVRISIG